MLRVFGLMLILFAGMSLTGCDEHPKDKTHLSDIIRCGFGQEYVNRSSGGYCRKQN